MKRPSSAFNVRRLGTMNACGEFIRQRFFCLRAGKQLAAALAAALLAGAAGRALAADNPLAMRTESVIGIDDVLRIALVLIVLLAVTSAALWWYQRRFGRLPPGFGERKPHIEVIARQRLSARTQLFVVRCGTQEFLVTESAAGASTLAIARDAPT